MKFNNEFIAGTLQEAVDIAATKLSQTFALTQLSENGVVTLEEAQNMYNMAAQILTEGSADLIPENLILEAEDATDDMDPNADNAPDPTMAQDTDVDADVDAGMGEEDLNLDDLEGIVLPDSEGNQYIIQGGILVPYEEDNGDDSSINGAAGGDTPNDGSDVDGSDDDLTKPEDDEGITEGSDLSKEGGDVNTVAPIEENSIFASNSSIVANLLKNTNFAK